MKNLDVVIPMFNSAFGIASVLESVLSQRLPKGWQLKLILTDDASTDGTLDLVQKRFFTKGIHVVQLLKNLGRGAACNAGVINGSGEYIMILDSDCILEGINCFAAHVHCLESGYDVSFSRISPAGSGFWTYYQKKVIRNRTQRALKGDYIALSTACFVIRRSMYQRIGGFDEQYRGYGFEDRDLIVRLLEFDARIKFHPNIIARHAADLSLFTVCKKLQEAGRTSAGLFSSKYPQQYADMAYSRVDVSQHPLTMGSVAAITAPFLPTLLKIGNKIVESIYFSRGFKVFTVKYLSALAFLIGTYFRR